MMSQTQVTLTRERYARGMTFEEYLEFMGSVENIRLVG